MTSGSLFRLVWVFLKNNVAVKNIHQVSSVVRIVMMFVCKKQKIKEKEAGVEPFFKFTSRTKI